MPKTVNSVAEYKHSLASRPVVVTLYHADWCEPCQQLGPQLEALESQFPNVLFVRIDVEKSEELAASQRVRGLPTVTFHVDQQRLEPSTVQGSNLEQIYHTITNLVRTCQDNVEPIGKAPAPRPQAQAQQKTQTQGRQGQEQQVQGQQGQVQGQVQGQQGKAQGQQEQAQGPAGIRKRQVMFEKPAAIPAPVATETSRVVEIESLQHYTQEVSVAPGLVVIDFNASWCMPCRQVAPFFKYLADTYGHVKFLSVNVDRCPDLASAMEVKSLPTFIIGAQGTQKDMFVGADTAYLESRVRYWSTNSA